VTEAQLINALNASYAADAACREAIESGGQVRIFSGRVSVDQLVRTYAIRVRHLAKLRAETVGSDDLIVRLSTAEGTVHLASVDTPDRHFVVFIDERDRVVSSWGVPARYRDVDQSPSPA